VRSSVAQVGVVVLVALVLAAPSFAGSTTEQSFAYRHVKRVVASPTPLGALSDDASFAVDVPRGVVVRVFASSGLGSAFVLHFESASSPDGASAVPSSSAAALLQGPRSGPDVATSWLVRVDPVVGVGFDANVTFSGFVSDVDGEPADFGFRDLPDDEPCVAGPAGAPGACLP
jgi:hypothetical protein